MTGPASACPENAEPSSSIGDRVFTGTTEDAGDDFEAGCGWCNEDDNCGEHSSDRAYQWTAPEAGRYTIDTNGSAFDTILHLLDACDGDELACNDDIAAGTNPQSSITLALANGQTVIIVVDGWGTGSYGEFQINIGPGGG